MSSQFTLASVKHATTVINGITAQSFTTGLQRILLAGSGQVDPTFAAVGRMEPGFTFTTNQIKTALANLGGISGIAIAASNFNFWLQLISASVTRSGSVHRKGTVIAGLLVPITLNIPRPPGVATISYQVFMISADGTTSPVGIASSQALDAGQAGSSEAYIMGAVTLNGSALDDVNSITVNFGNNVQVSGGLSYPTNVAIMSRKPSIVIATEDVSIPAGWTETGVAQSATDSTIVLSDVSEGGVRGSSPITITLDEGLIEFDAIGGSEEGRLGTSITYTPTYDGTAAIMALTGLT